MGWMDRIKKAVSSGGAAGPVGIAPSEAFPTSVELLHAGLSRLAGPPAREGAWLSISVRDANGRELGVVQHSTGGIVNLCDRDDIDLPALLTAAGREDLAARCDRRDSALFDIEGATLEEVAYAIELVLVSGFAPPTGSTFEAKIEA